MHVDRPRHASRRARSRGTTVGALAIALAIAVVGSITITGPAAAADPSPSPSASAPPRPVATLVPVATLAPVATPTPSPSPRPTATPAPSRTSASTARSLTDITGRPAVPSATLAPVLPTDVLLYRSGAMVEQYTNYWCVPAAVQSMVNLILGTSDRSYATQERYYKGIRAHNRYTYATKGNDPVGWAWGLRAYTGYTTSYVARSYTDRDAAHEAIVAGIDRSHTPVGVTVHGGTHAWVILGYRAQPDPADPTKRTILGFYVNGPLGSPTDPWPYEYLTVSQFDQHYSTYHEWQFDVIWEDTWVVISQ